MRGTLLDVKTLVAVVAAALMFAALASLVERALAVDIHHAIVIDGPSATGTVSNAGDRLVFSFEGTAGQQLGLGLSNVSFGSGCCSADVSVLRPNGASLTSSFFGNAGGERDIPTLPDSGTYTIVIDPQDQNIGSVTLTLSTDLSAGPIVIDGASASVTTTRIGQNARYSFEGTAGQQLGLGLSGVSFGSGCCSAHLSVRRPNGTQLMESFFGNADGERDLPTLTHSGTYTIVIDPQDQNTGSVTVRVKRRAAWQPVAQTFGSCEWKCLHARNPSGLLSDPVNTATGAFVDSVSDVSLPGVGIGFEFVRNYTSADVSVGRLGPGWTDSYAVSLTVAPDGDVVLRGEEGQRVEYAREVDGSFVAAAGGTSVLHQTPTGYELTRADQVRYGFDSTGRLLGIHDRNGQGLSFAYDAGGRQTAITDSVGRVISLSYFGDGRLQQVSLPDGRSVSYAYTNGRLSSVVDVRGKTWTYTYDAGGRLASIVDPLNHTTVSNVYGTDGRVSNQTDALGKTTTFAWDQATQTATVTDANGKQWKDVYASNVLLRRIDPLGNATVLEHDPALNNTSVTGPDGSTTTMTHDAAGNLLTATAPPSLASARKTFAYNTKNDPTQITDARNKVTSYTYTPAGNVESATQDGVQVASYTYDGQGRVLTSTDANGKSTTYAYDASGNLASVTQPDPDGAGPQSAPMTTYTFDAAGRMLTRVDPLGNVPGGTPSQHTTTFTYNAAGQLLTETDPLGHVTTNVYDDAGRLTSTTDANNHTTSYSYDNADRLLNETGPDPDGAGPLTAPVTSYTYDDVGNKLSETDPRGHTTTYTYDNANRLASTTGPDPDGAGPLTAPKTTYTYDASGNLASMVEPRGNVSGANPNDYKTTYTYDAAGRLLTTADPLGNVTTNTYDPVGNLASVEDANNHVTSYTYDASGRILTVTAPDPDGAGPLSAPVTSYGYDANGNRLTRTDANSHVTSYSYDALNRLTSVTSPDPDGAGAQTPSVTTYGYDANGNRLSVTDPNGNGTGTAGDGTTSYAFDRANRLTSIDYSDSTPDVSFTLDDVGNRLSMTDGAGTQTRAYDNLDRLLTVTRSGSSFSYVYDAAGNVTKRTYPDGTVVDYSYDPLNRLASVVSGTRTTTYAYDPASNLTTTTLPAENGHVETRTYDRAGRLMAVKSDKTGTVLADITYTRDPVGNPLTETRTGTSPGSKTFTYDNTDRLTGVCFQADSCPGGSDPFIRWTYDGVGNRLTEQRPAGTTNYSYDGLDRMLTAGSTSFTYDKNGNQLTAGSKAYTYDLGNRLKTADDGTTTTTYSYDGDGIRAQASTGAGASQKTNFSWDVNQGLPQLVRESDGDNALLRRYVHGPQPLWMSTTSGDAFYYHSDPLGSVRNVTSQTGSTQLTYDYEPYGAIRTQTGSSPANFLKFTGEFQDPTGLYHLRARQYDVIAGRFTSLDPAEPASSEPLVNAYAYAGNRPSLMVDPSGRTPHPSDAALQATRLSSSPTDIVFPGPCIGPRCPTRPGVSSGWLWAVAGGAAAGVGAIECARRGCFKDNDPELYGPFWHYVQDPDDLRKIVNTGVLKGKTPRGGHVPNRPSAYHSRTISQGIC